MMSVFAGKYKEFLKLYYYIGGMPEAVQTYLDTKNFASVRTVQKQLLLYYAGDFSKHAAATAANSPIKNRMTMVLSFKSIPHQVFI